MQTDSTPTLASEDACALKMVELGYAVNDPTDRERCLMFRARFETREGVDAALRAIDRYNGFDAERIIEALDGAELGERTSIDVGREGSPVVYVGPFWGADDSRPEVVMNALRGASADEVDYDGRLVRAWWD